MGGSSLVLNPELGGALPSDSASQTEGSIKALISDAKSKLMAAETSADILDARTCAGIAYDAASRLSVLAGKRRHHEAMVSAARALQLDALEIEFLADRRLADEVDAARDAGLLCAQGRPSIKHGKEGRIVLSDIGVARGDLFRARQVRDALSKAPGVLRLALNDVMERGSPITRSFVRKEVLSIASDLRGAKRRVSVVDGSPCVLAFSGDVRKRTFSEIRHAIAKLEFEASALRRICGHIANPDPFMKIGDAISDDVLGVLCARAHAENGGAP